MAERSKAPDSRFTLLTDSERAFWSSSEGVGSNLTFDIKFFVYNKKKKCSIVNIVFPGVNNFKLFNKNLLIIQNIIRLLLSPVWHGHHKGLSSLGLQTERSDRPSSRTTRSVKK
jgi:hypothetical protein